MPQHRPYIGAIFGPNIICMFLHIFTARSEAGEAMRGYLHGGVIIDLIGQKGPTSKLHLVILDIFGSGAAMLHASCACGKGEACCCAGCACVPTPAVDQPRVEVVSAQDHDAEERGVMREGVSSNGDIELRPMISDD